MSCPFEEDLTAYVDRELSTLRERQVSLHLPTCASCRSTLGLLERTVARVETMPAFEPSAGLRRAVLNRIDQPPALLDRLRAALTPGVMMPSFGLAAAALVVVVLNQSNRNPPGPPLLEPGQLELATNLEMVEDYDVLGLESPEDVEVVRNLKELEAKP